MLLGKTAAKSRAMAAAEAIVASPLHFYFFNIYTVAWKDERRAGWTQSREAGDWTAQVRLGAVSGGREEAG